MVSRDISCDIFSFYNTFNRKSHIKIYRAISFMHKANSNYYVVYIYFSVYVRINNKLLNESIFARLLFMHL